MDAAIRARPAVLRVITPPVFVRCENLAILGGPQEYSRGCASDQRACVAVAPPRWPLCCLPALCAGVHSLTPQNLTQDRGFGTLVGLLARRDLTRDKHFEAIRESGRRCARDGAISMDRRSGKPEVDATSGTDFGLQTGWTRERNGHAFAGLAIAQPAAGEEAYHAHPTVSGWP